MRIVFISFTVIFCSLTSFGQKNNAERFYLWKVDWTNTTNADSAAYLSKLIKVSDSCWQMDTWRYSGPMVSSEQFRDELIHIQNGKQYYYHASGYIDSTGMFVDGLPEGEWGYCDEEGHVVMKKHYSKGQLISSEKTPISDTTQNKLLAGEKESSFPGGLAAWKKYLLKKMNFPDRAQKLNINGIVVVEFIVDTSGDIEMVALHKSVEYSVDEAALSIIKNSPKWDPAQKDGHPVKSYKRQPLAFKLQ